MRKLKILLLTILMVLFFPTIASAQEKKPDHEVVITNITSVSFTVSWFSIDKVDEAIQYGTAEPLTTWAVDDRGPGLKRSTHHVTLKNLQPDTEYLFRIGTEGKLFKQKTATALNDVLPPLAETFKGNIRTEDKVAPEEAILYMKVENANILSTPIDYDGNWLLRTATMRNANLTEYKKMLETNYVDIYVRSGFQGDVFAKTYAFERSNPINLVLEEARIPFYKIKLPETIFYPAQAAESSPPPAGTAQPASGENFFQVVWKRIREIF